MFKISRAIVFVGLLLVVGCKFHVLDDGQYYRMSQPTYEQLSEIHKRNGIGTIINLRGEHFGDKWFDDEFRFAQESGIEMVNIAMSATSIPSRRNLIRLLDAFRDAPRPLLVHCRAGVDRTGEASALYAMLYMGQSKNQALEMLSAEYGHVPGIAPKAKRYFIETVWKGEEWARQNYYPCKQNYKYFNYNQCDKNGEEKLILTDENED